MSNNRNLGNIATAITNATSGQVLTSQGNGVATFADAAGGSGVTTYANKTAIDAVSSPSEGDLAFDEDKNVLYIRAGSAWERIQHGGNVGPQFTTTPASSLALSSGSTSTITAVAVDENGFPVTYDWDGISGSTVYTASSLPDQVTNVSESNGVFTLTPSTNSSHAGTFTFRTKASDGAQVSTATTNVSLAFGESIVVPQDTTRGIAATGTDEYSYNYGGSTANSGGASSNLLDYHSLGSTFYFEVEIQGNSGISGGFIGIGIDGGAYGYNSTDQVSLYLYQNGAVKYSGNTATGFGALSTGDKVGFKVTDGTSGPVVTMYLNGTADTAGSYTLPSGGSGRVKIWFGSGAGSGATHSGKFLSSASSYGDVQYLPSGAVSY